MTGTMDHLDDVTSALEALTAEMDREPDLGVVLQAVCEQVVQVVPGADMASITLIQDGDPRTAASSDRRARDIDDEQYKTGDGPCLRAAATGNITRIEVGTADELWPTFAASARAEGVGSFLAAPLPVDDGVHGAVNLFGFGDHGFANSDSKLLDLYVTVVVFGLRSLRRHAATVRQTGQLRQALATRAVIDQAKGILMAVHKVTADEAFGMLVRLSQDRNEKLNDVAAEFVATASKPV
jgi:GAF domain-containing protein